MSALQHYFDAERLRRGWSMREAAKRSLISLSKAYAIVKGDDNVEFETFENIATAFNMSPAELAVAIGKGAVAEDPKRVSIHAALREVPDDQLAGTGTANQAGHPRNGGGRNSGGADIISSTRGLVLARSTAVLAWICRPLHPLGAPTAATA